MGKTNVQSRKRSKKENVQKTQEKTHKKGKIEKIKKREKGRTCKNIQICEDVSQKGKKLLKMQKCQIRVSHRQRQQEEKKETTDEQIDEQKEDIKR